MKITSKDIEKAVFGWGSNCIWNPGRVLGTTHSTGVAGWEADMLILQPTGNLYEIEIKVSVSDFKREFTHKTAKHRKIQSGFQSRISRFYFAMPEDIYEKVKDQVPSQYGVILVSPTKIDRWGRLRPWVEKTPKALQAIKSDPEWLRLRLLEAVHARYWSEDYRENGKGIQDPEASTQIHYS